jgi:ATP-dependent helicase/nuclease subunit A
LGGETVPDWLVRQAQSPLEWLLYALAEYKTLHEAFATPVAEQASADGLFTFMLHGPTELEALSQLVRSLRDRKAKRSPAVSTSDRGGQGERLLARLKERLDWHYPFAEAVTQRAKSSVTELTHQGDESVRRDYSASLKRRPVALATEDSHTERPANAAAFGTAVHLLMAQIDLGGPVTSAGIEQTRDKLVADGALADSIAKRIDVEAVTTFFDTEPGLAAIAAENQVWREWPFTFGEPVADQGQAPDIMVVQGIIDMLVETPDGLLVVDFKTDRIGPGDVAARVESYRGQVELYAKAAGEILKQPVLSQWLYFFEPREAVRL